MIEKAHEMEHKPTNQLAKEWICHRVNTVEELQHIPLDCGVELDLRDEQGELIMVHDPFSTGQRFEEYLKHYRHGTMILNVKSERIEDRVLELVSKHNITDYFFLDSSFPMIVQLNRQGERKVALRYSEYEGLDTIRNMAGRVDWVWVDCFTRLPLDAAIAKELRDLGYKLCLVSPELQGRQCDIPVYRDYCRKEGLSFDAICTKVKNLALWQEA